VLYLMLLKRISSASSTIWVIEGLSVEYAAFADSRDAENLQGVAGPMQWPIKPLEIKLQFFNAAGGQLKRSSRPSADLFYFSFISPCATGINILNRIVLSEWFDLEGFK